MRRPFGLLTLAISTLVLIACPGGGDNENPAPTAPAGDETISLTPANANVSVGDRVKYACVSSKSGVEIECSNFREADPSVAFVTSISYYGYAKATGPGTTTITGTSYPAGRLGSTTITVHPLTYELTPSAATLAPEQSTTIRVTLKDHRGNVVPMQDGYRFTWTANPTDGVSVAPSGANNATAVVIAKKSGITVVSAVMSDPTDVYRVQFGAGGTATITVPDPLNVTSTMSSFTIREGQSISIPYTARTSTGSLVTDGVTTTAVTGGCAVVNTGSAAVTVQGNVAGPCSLRITVTRNGVAGSVTVPGTVTGLTSADLIGTYSKLGSRESTCSPSAFGPNFVATLNVIADAVNPAGIRLEEVHPTVTLFWSFITATPIPGGLRLVTGTPTRTIGGRNYVTYLEAEFVGGTLRGYETFTLEETSCVERYAITGQRQ